MNPKPQAVTSWRMHQAARAALGRLPRSVRFAFYRWMIDCDPRPDPRLELGIASGTADLEACFGLLHDAYVSSGFMRPDPSGLRVTAYHALPTTTTLYARFDGEVAGTLSIIREGVFGFPLQSVFKLDALRAQTGRIAEISALAVHPKFRKTGGAVLFPLMKFMYEYCTAFFDTRHLVIAVHPNKVELYESLLFFRRLQAQVVDNYDFANGAPAVGATLDLQTAPEVFRNVYEGRSPRKDLHRYFTRTPLPHIRFPDRPYFTTNDPVMSPALLNHFFNERTDAFHRLDARQRRLLHEIYHEDCYRDVLPPLIDAAEPATSLRRYRRHSMRCPAWMELADGSDRKVALEVVDISLMGFMAVTSEAMTSVMHGKVQVALGAGCMSTFRAQVVRAIASDHGHVYGFRIFEPDAAWRRCVAHLDASENPIGPARGLAAQVDSASPAWSAHEAVTA